MIHFEQGEWWNMPGRGNVFSTKMPETINYSLINKEVMIQGHVYTVIGVERFALNDPTLHQYRSVGLLVKGEIKK